MVVSPLWAVAFGALWVLVALIAVGQALLIRYTLRLERELLDTTDGPEVGSAVVPVRLIDLAGQPIELPGAGRRTAVFFMSPSCPACGQVARGLAALPDLPGWSVLVVCQAGREAARRYAERLDLGYPVVPDPDGAAMRAFQVTGIPFAVVLGRDGLVQRKGVPATYNELLELLGITEGEDGEPHILRPGLLTGAAP